MELEGKITIEIDGKKFEGELREIGFEDVMKSMERADKPGQIEGYFRTNPNEELADLLNKIKEEREEKE